MKRASFIEINLVRKDDRQQQTDLFSKARSLERKVK